MSAPVLWFEDFKKVRRSEIYGFRLADNPLSEARAVWREKVAKADVLIVGGGGLLEIDYFQKALSYLAENRKRNSKMILWGAGHNKWEIADWRHIKQQVSLEKYGFDLIGIRDFNHGHRWVPCPSCMSNLFDENIEPIHEVVMYAHTDTMIHEDLRRNLPTDMPLLSNSAGFEEAIRFLASGDLVLTDSFHGMYWATLLGRRVIAFPSSSKFYSPRHAVPLCDPSDWRRFERLAQRYPEALEECREANRSFADDVLQWL